MDANKGKENNDYFGTTEDASPHAASKNAHESMIRKKSEMKYSAFIGTERRLQSARSISRKAFGEAAPNQVSDIIVKKDVDDALNKSPISKEYLSSPPKEKIALPDVTADLNKVAVPPKQSRLQDVYGKQSRTVSSSASAKTRGRKSASAKRMPMPPRTHSAPTHNRAQPAALSVKREMQQRKEQRLRRDAEKGDGRRNLDKKSARLIHSAVFKADIASYRQRFQLNDGSNHSDKALGEIQRRARSGATIALRKRPIFGYELDRGDYDVVSIDNTSQTEVDVCIIHKAEMHPDMQQKLMKHVSVPLTAAFDEHCTDDSIYRHVAQPLVLEALNGRVATIMMYGATGAGKSFTISGIEQRAVSSIFDVVDTSQMPVSLQFIELCGSREINDLLVKRSNETVKLADQDDGTCKVLGAITVQVANADELMDAIRTGKSRRATEATDKNGTSSRSHSVCQIRIGTGCLNLLDLAGSERRGDSLYDDSQRQKESAEINASLWALKVSYVAFAFTLVKPSPNAFQGMYPCQHEVQHN